MNNQSLQCKACNCDMTKRDTKFINIKKRNEKDEKLEGLAMSMHSEWIILNTVFDMKVQCINHFNGCTSTVPIYYQDRV